MSSLLRHHSLRVRIRLVHLSLAQTQTTKHGQKKVNNNNNTDETESTLHTHASSSSKRAARAPITTESLTPGSQQTITDPTAREEFGRADAKMSSRVEWLRREVSQLEARASGRVTPQLLAPVRVSVSMGPPSAASASASSASEAKKEKARLEEVATVGVRDGTTLIVTVFDPQNLKPVQDALYDAKIQGVIPQRVDERTLRIPIPKPTVEARQAAYSNASKLAEDARVQIRRQHQASLKKGKYPRHSTEYHEFQKLQERHVAEVDTVLARMKRSTGAR
ncbi:ribosome recycling factor domain-containing protein [Russula aff. rugulosa BPL654]|nr:ribosome recycling factor domain-containing protein [Russula aff. rugulosa BPL654]